jgi:choline dehydrogenase-like flavoprotein
MAGAEQHEADAIVVGSGAAGGWAALELAEAGRSVALIEAGRRLDPEADFPEPTPRFAWQDLVRDRRRGFHVQARCDVFRQGLVDFFVNDRDAPYQSPRGAPFNWFRGRQVGGRLHTWSRVALRMSEREFRPAAADGVGPDWPIGLEDLTPHYDRVERLMGIVGSREGLAEAPDPVAPEPREPTPDERAFADAVAAGGLGARVIPARTIAHNPVRVPPTVAAALATGRTRLVHDTIVDRLEVDERSGAVVGVCTIDARTMAPGVVRAPLVLLCAGAIESVRILLNSRSDRHPSGVGGASGWLGRALMDHLKVTVGGPLAPGERSVSPPEDPYDLAAYTGIYVPPFRNQGSERSAFVRGYGIQGGIGRCAHAWHLASYGEMLPDPSNRVTLHPRRRDRWGVPIPRIVCRHGANDRLMIADQARALRAMARSAGLEIGEVPPHLDRGNLRRAHRWVRARRAGPGGGWFPGGAVHEVGGARMGDDPASSVVDPWCRVWEAPNVIVADGACFPTCSSKNVTLTIMALATRAARAALER